MIIGITGKSGVGKSTYARKIAEESGFFVVHVDKISHQIINLDTIKIKLIDIFGDEAVKDGVVDRKYIGNLVFTNKNLYEQLNDLTWELMKLEIDHILSTHENVILDWILLPHSHYWKMCDKKILITANEKQRKEIIMQRDNVSKEYLEKRDSASISYDDVDFDEIVYNEYT